MDGAELTGLMLVVVMVGTSVAASVLFIKASFLKAADSFRDK